MGEVVERSGSGSVLVGTAGLEQKLDLGPVRQDQEDEPVVAAVQLQSDQVLDLAGVEQTRLQVAVVQAGREPGSGLPAGPRPVERLAGGWSGP